MQAIPIQIKGKKPARDFRRAALADSKYLPLKAKRGTSALIFQDAQDNLLTYIHFCIILLLMAAKNYLDKVENFSLK